MHGAELYYSYKELTFGNYTAVIYMNGFESYFS